MTNPTDLLAEVTRRAEDACPCRMYVDTGAICGENCRCAPASIRAASIMGDDLCKWKGHAAITRALEVAQKVGEIRGLDWVNGRWTNRHVVAERDRLLRELEDLR